jgi:very-short-patch-repair endonuclease
VPWKLSLSPGVSRGGQHYDGPQRDRDAARDAWLGEQGIRVVRYSDRDVLLEPEAVEEAIWELLREIEGDRRA